MTKYKNIILSVFAVLTIVSFKPGKDYKPILVHITGHISDFRTDLPIKKYPLFIGTSQVKYFTLSDYDGNIAGRGESNIYAQFAIDTWINKNDPTFWLITKDYAQIKFQNLDTASLMYGDTINLGQIFLVSYDRELQKEEYNIPKTGNKQMNKDLKKYKLSEIRYLFPFDSIVKGITLNSIDTTNLEITRLNFGSDNPRGTIIQSYKTLTFKVNLSK